MLNEKRIIARKPSVCIHNDKHSSCIYDFVGILQAETMCYHSLSTPVVPSFARPADGKGYDPPKGNKSGSSTSMGLYSLANIDQWILLASQSVLGFKHWLKDSG